MGSRCNQWLPEIVGIQTRHNRVGNLVWPKRCGANAGCYLHMFVSRCNQHSENCPVMKHGWKTLHSVRWFSHCPEKGRAARRSTAAIYIVWTSMTSRWLFKGGSPAIKLQPRKTLGLVWFAKNAIPLPFLACVLWAKTGQWRWFLDLIYSSLASWWLNQILVLAFYIPISFRPIVCVFWLSPPAFGSTIWFP